MTLPHWSLQTLLVALTVSILLTPPPSQTLIQEQAVNAPIAVSVVPLFPPASEMNSTSYVALSQHLVSAFNLSSIDSKRTSIGSRNLYDCCLRDWGNRSVPLENDSVIVLFTVTNQSLFLTYSSGGSLARIAAYGVLGQPLPDAKPSTIKARLDSIAVQIGVGSVPSAYVSWNEVEPVVLNGSTRFVNTTTLARYSNYSGSPVAFGNEIQMTVDLDHGLVVGLTLYPWTTSSPPPTISAPDAYSRALSFLNRTPMGGDYRYNSGKIFFAFDSVHYAVVYQVSAIYGAGNSSSATGLEWDVWVDATSGKVTYVVEVLPHPSALLGGPAFPLSSLLTLVAIVASAILLVVGFASYSEPFWFAMFGLLVPLYFRLAKSTALEHFVRGQLYAQIVSHPGISFSELREAFGLQNGSVTYHIAVLEALGFIRTETDGRRKRMYASTTHGKVLGRFLSDTQYKILEAVRQLGSAGPTEVAHALGMSKQRVAYNLKRLGEFGMLVPDADVEGKFRVVPKESGDAEQIDPLP